MVFTATFESAATRYVAALLVTGAALLLRVLLTPILGDYFPYVTLFGAVAFSAWFCGTGPTASATVFGLLGARYWLIHPTHSFSIPDKPQSAGAVVFLFASGAIIAFGEINQRNSEKVRAAQEALEAQVRQRTADLQTANQQLRALTGHVLHLQDEERRRIARELHDTAGQSLAILSINLGKAKSEIDRLVKTSATLSDSLSVVSELTTNIRTISYLLHPPMLDEAGLGPALRWYIQGFTERSKIAVDLDLPEDFGRLPSDVETAMFRIVQECLTNIVRHAESPVAQLRVSRSASEACVEVRDKGKGVSPDRLAEIGESSTPGVGIRGMRERVRQLGGTLEISSDGEGKGTVVIARFPAASPATAAATAGHWASQTRN